MGDDFHWMSYVTFTCHYLLSINIDTFKETVNPLEHPAFAHLYHATMLLFLELCLGYLFSCAVFVGVAVNMGLQLQGLSCTRGHRALFNGVSISLEAGHLLRVKGANGAGKTSLLRMLSGLLAPTEGHLLWLGQPIAGQRTDFGRSVVYLGHAAALKDELSPLENLLDACELAGHTTDTPAALAALQGAGLRGFERIAARRLSQGQRKRSALARLALSRSSPLWILDEPFNALDTAASAWLTALIEDHLQNAGMVVLTSHQDIPINTAHQQELIL
jgi:heme exporter protein A